MTIPRLAPRRGHRRRSSTQFAPPVPPSTQQQLRPPRTAKNVQGQENNMNDSESVNDDDSSHQMDLVANAAIDSHISKLPTSSSPKPSKCSGAAPPWSPPRSTTTKKDRSSLNVTTVDNAAAITANEGCTTPTNDSQLYHDFPQQPYFMTSSLGGSSSNYRFHDASLALTPPASAPAPLLVSAKRLGTEVRSLHSKRRRASRRSYLCNSERSESDQLDEGLQPFADPLHPQYGRKGPVRRFDRWKESDHEDAEGHYLDDDEDDNEPYPLLPPLLKTLSPQEQKRRYWQLCYGADPPTVAPTPPSANVANTTVGEVSWSASRAPPTRSCLSSTKKASWMAMTTMTPAHASGECWTPKASPDEDFAARTHSETSSQSRKTKTVQFGSPKAAEYEIGAPSGAMTPLPADVARARFPVDDPDEHPRNHEAHEMELKLIKETKINTQLLQAWETTFDDFDESTFNVDEGQDSDQLNQDSQLNAVRPAPIGCILPPMDDDFEAIDARTRRLRRNSGFFSQSDVSAAFFSSSDSDEDNTDEEDDDKQFTAAEPDEDDSIACHIATLSMEATMTSEASTPIPSTTEGLCGSGSVIIQETTPPAHSEESSMEITPPSATSNTAMAMTPPSDVSYSSVHSSGAAFAKSAVSPTVGARPLLECRALEFGKDSDSSGCEDKSTIDILETLRRNPNAEGREWDTCAMLRTMARHGITSCTHSETTNADDTLCAFLAIAAMNPYCNNLVQTGVEAFVSHLDSCTTTTPLVTSTTGTEEIRSKGTKSGEYNWMLLETTFWEHVNDGLDDLRDGLAALSKGVSCAQVPDVQSPEPSLLRRTLKRKKKRLQSSLVQMQAAATKERQSQDLLKARLMRLKTRCNLEGALPFSVLTFRMTASLLSFAMVGCTDSTAVWRMDHAVDGVESEVTWNMETGELCGRLVVSDEDSVFGEADKVPRNHVASQLHQILAVMCMEASHHFLHRNEYDVSTSNQVNEDVLPNCLAHLAVALGRIDMVVRSLWVLAEEKSSTISLQPSVTGSTETAHVIIDLDGGEDEKRTVRITFESSHALPLPSKVEVAMIKVGSSDYPVSGWNTLEDWHSSNRPWATGTLFQDIICAAAAS